MKLSSRVIKFGDDISTDLIIAGKYTKTIDTQSLVDHVMEDLDPEFKEKVIDRGFIVAGKNFGCGSSREQAPVALKQAGVLCVVATSFARIFYRNAINIGLPLVECNTEKIADGDILEYSVGTTWIMNNSTGEKIEVEPLPEIMVKILRAGGVVEYLRKGNELV